MENLVYAPVLLFVYNRPAHTRRLVESLLQNPESAESRLFIYSDAPRDEAARPAVDEVRRYVRSLKGFKQVNVVERAENWGLARNVIDGVTTLLRDFDRVIVLEDDLILSPAFLRFMNDALETYRDEPRVGHIQACDFTQDPSLPDTFLIKWTGSWGWATWRRAWQLFNPDGRALLRELEARGLTRVFDFDGTYRYTRMLRRQVEGKNNSWAIRWNASLFLADVLSLNVGRSLVQNAGFADDIVIVLLLVKLFDHRVEKLLMFFLLHRCKASGTACGKGVVGGKAHRDDARAIFCLTADNNRRPKGPIPPLLYLAQIHCRFKRQGLLCAIEQFFQVKLHSNFLSKYHSAAALLRSCCSTN